MTASSIKSRWISLCALCCAAAAPAADFAWKLRYDLRYGYHLLETGNSTRDLATHRHQMEAEAKLTLGELSAVADLRAWAESAFATNATRYGGQPVIAEQSSEILPRDLYLQYKSDHLVVRLGNQQVVWGEAFGFYFADIVNPKDLRELGIGDLEQQRLPTPLLNAKLILDDYSLQLVYVPKPYFNKLPSLGSDFAAPFFAAVPPGFALTVNRDRTLPLALDNGEIGARATALVAGVDLSVFWLHYFDRMPSFQVRPTGPTTLVADPVYPRVDSLGATATADLSMFLLRLEALYTAGRKLTGPASTGYALLPTDQLTGVLGLDYTRLEKWRVGLQISESYLTRDISTAVTPRSLPILSLHANGTPWSDHSLDVILSYIFNDGSSLTELRYWIPASDQLEIGAGADLWTGSGNSQFGQFKQASRGYVLVKAYFNK
jgi:hypothetical protein